MYELFGFNPITGRKDYTSVIIPTEAGYRQLESQLKMMAGKGFRFDPNDEELKRLALEKGKTVEDFLKYDLGIF